jgi:tetratricopeptide (TPR) repeat protein
MVSTSKPPQAQTAPSDLALVTSVIQRLRAEHDATESTAAKAILLHELGVLSEALGDEAGSARDQLGAVNADPDFREPLERLIAIIERRQSYKNLGKLLERLVRVAETPEERARALLDQASFASDHEGDDGTARMLLEGAADESPDDASLWLALELSAGKTSDSDLRDRALAARARLAQDPLWKQLLLIDLGELRSAGGESVSARQALEEAVGLGSSATFEALEALAQFARVSSAPDVEERALEALADAIALSLTNPQAADKVGVPRYKRSSAQAAYAWLMAADRKRTRGDLAGATSLLDQALELIPSEPLLVRARLNAAETTGDTATAARLSRAELARGVKGELAAAHQLRIAEAAAAVGDPAGARAAIEQALAADPASIPARALYLDILGGGADPQALAAALEGTAEHLPSDEAKSRHYLMAAEVYARSVGDAQGAKLALSQAGLSGATPALVGRLARLLAALTGDAGWYEEATRRLMAQGASDGEPLGLWLELARARALRGDRTGAMAAFQSIAKLPDGAWLGSVLSACVAPLITSGESADENTGLAEAVTLLEQLAEVVRPQSEARARALQTVGLALTRAAGNAESYLTRLRALHADDATDLVVARALERQRRDASDVPDACAVLEATARALGDGDADLAASLWLEAGLLRFRSGDRKGALSSFEQAEQRSEVAAQLVTQLARRATAPDDLEARRQVLTAAGAHETGVATLERFGLEAGRDGNAAAAADALETVPDAATPDEISTALSLGRALWGSSPRDLQRRSDALKDLSKRSTAAAAACGAALFVLALGTEGALGSPELLEAAAGWAAADGSTVAALEWLAAATAAGDSSAEVQARRTLAGRVSGPSAAALAAGSDLVSWLSGMELDPPAASQDPAVRLANLELAGPGCDPRRRAAALLDVGELLGLESTPLATALAGMNQLAYGDVAQALDSFRRVVDAHPEDIAGWEGLRAAAEAAGDRTTLAEACAALGDAVSDSTAGGRLWAQTATILLDELNDPSRGEFALSRAVERDIKQAGAFDRLFRIVRQRKDDERLLDLIARRLAVADDPDEIAKLFWERARVLRGKGDREGALSALENVRMLEPDHVGALALSGEIFITVGRFEEAASHLAELASHPQAPTQQRLMSGVAAVDLFENKLQDPARALKVLLALHAAKLSTLPVRERLAKVATKAGNFEEAVKVLETLMNERDTREGRIQAARLALVVYRDKLKRPSAAQAAVEKLLSEAPDDGEAIDLVLTGAIPESKARPLLARAQMTLVQRLTDNPLDADRVLWLAKVAQFLGNMPQRQATLGALAAIGRGSPEIDKELAGLDRRVANVPKIAIDDASLPNLADPDDRGAVAELMRVVATTITEALGPNLQAFGVTKKERVDPRAGLPIRNEIMAWAGALGIGELELYVGGNDPGAVRALALETPAMVLGANLTAPLSPIHRQAVARELYALRRGTTALSHREPDDVAAIIVAACRLGDVELEAPSFAMLGEFHRLLTKEASGWGARRMRKLLPDLARAVQAEAPDLLGWVRAATSSLDRMAAIAAGDVSWVLGGTTRTPVGEGREDRARAERLLAFVLSPTYLDLREQLGMGVR